MCPTESGISFNLTTSAYAGTHGAKCGATAPTPVHRPRTPQGNRARASPARQGPRSCPRPVRGPEHRPAAKSTRSDGLGGPGSGGARSPGGTGSSRGRARSRSGRDDLATGRRCFRDQRPVCPSPLRQEGLSQLVPGLAVHSAPVRAQTCRLPLHRRRPCTTPGRRTTQLDLPRPLSESCPETDRMRMVRSRWGVLTRLPQV